MSAHLDRGATGRQPAYRTVAACTMDESSFDQQMTKIPIKKNALTVLCILYTLLILWVGVGTSALYFGIAKPFCGCNTNDDSDTMVAKKTYDERVEALAGGHNTHDVCWNGLDEDAPTILTILQDPLGNGVPWVVYAKGEVCYPSEMVPASAGWTTVPDEDDGYDLFPSSST